jgi:hypothetical protein
VRGEVSRNKRVIEEEEGIVEGEEGEWDSDSLSKRCEAYQTAVAMGKMVDMIEESLRCVVDRIRLVVWLILFLDWSID